jgi:hypothetical protein
MVPQDLRAKQRSRRRTRLPSLYPSFSFLRYFQASRSVPGRGGELARIFAAHPYRACRADTLGGILINLWAFDKGEIRGDDLQVLRQMYAEYRHVMQCIRQHLKNEYRDMRPPERTD